MTVLSNIITPSNVLTTTNTATVKTWLADKLDLVTMEAGLDAQLAELKAPKVATGLPWATE